jgi:hypothetical protein
MPATHTRASHLKLTGKINIIMKRFATFDVPKDVSGDAWEVLFVLILLVRALTGNAH